MGPVQEPCGVEPEEGQLELYIKRLEKKVEQLQARLDGESIYCAPQWLEEGLDFALENLEKVTAPVRAPIRAALGAPPAATRAWCAGSDMADLTASLTPSASGRSTQSRVPRESPR